MTSPLAMSSEKPGALGFLHTFDQRSNSISDTESKSSKRLVQGLVCWRGLAVAWRPSRPQLPKFSVSMTVFPVRLRNAG
jgi:hypothetical protein